jgi:hypothetical protein
MGATIEPVSVPHEMAGPAKVLTLAGRYHQLMDLTALRTDLGYTDVLPAVEAIAETARWYAANRPDPGGDIEQRLGDPFDYEREDRLIDAAGEALDLLRRAVAADRPAVAARADSERDGVGPGGRHRPHPYAHPKQANEARDHRGR